MKRKTKLLYKYLLLLADRATDTQHISLGRRDSKEILWCPNEDWVGFKKDSFHGYIYEPIMGDVEGYCQKCPVCFEQID